MAKVLEMPKLSPTMTEGQLTVWHKKEGDKVAAGEEVADVETDKAVMPTALVLRSSVRVSGHNAAFIAAVGLGDTLGNVLFAASSAQGLVSVTSVLASLYPIVTVVLARFVLRERVDRAQEAGIVATLVGVVLISTG